MIGSKHVLHVKNPLSTYQRFTKADTRKLLSAIGSYEFINVKAGISKLMKINR